MEEAEREKKSAAYLAIINEVFGKYGYEGLAYQWNTDPWSPHEHYIVKSEKRRFLGIIPDKKYIAVADIEVEPYFMSREMKKESGRHPVIRIIRTNNPVTQNPDMPKIAVEFCERCKKEFGLSWVIK